MAFEWKNTIRYSETGRDGRLTVKALLDYFQDIATLHAEELGVGLAYMQPQHMAWFLASWQIVVYRYPKYAEKVIVGTFPYRFKASIGCRNFFLKTEEGELLAVADSKWTLMNTAENRMVLPTEKILTTFTVEEKLEMNYKGKRIKTPSELTEQEPFWIRPHHLDGNGHVNNSQFVQMAMEYLPVDSVVTELRVEYKHQLQLNQKVYAQTGCIEDDDTQTVIVTLNTEENGACAVVSFLLENKKQQSED